MDKELLTYVLDQAVGVVIAVFLLTRIERRLDVLITSIEITLLQKTTFASTVLNVQTSLEWDGQLQRLAAILTPMERTVLGLRLADLSDAGIAGRLQISRQRVLKIRKQLQAKYRQVVG